jgi:hypothetical protein
MRSEALYPTAFPSGMRRKWAVKADAGRGGYPEGMGNELGLCRPLEWALSGYRTAWVWRDTAHGNGHVCTIIRQLPTGMGRSRRHGPAGLEAMKPAPAAAGNGPFTPRSLS